MTRRSLVLFVPLIALAMAAPASADHAWGPYHWARTSNPFPLTIVDSVTSEWQSTLGTAVSDWDRSTVLTLSNAQGDEGSTSRKKCNPIAGKVRVCNQKYGFNGWLGVANIWLTSGNHIAQGTTKLNDSYFTTSTYNKPEWRQFVMCQEIGHDFGLDHTDENFDNPNQGTCMDYTNNPLGPPSNTAPNAHDYDQLSAMYAHTDSFNSWGAQTASVGRDLVADDTVDVWVGDETSGRSVHVTRDGPYVVVTHIYWV